MRCLRTVILVPALFLLSMPAIAGDSADTTETSSIAASDEAVLDLSALDNSGTLTDEELNAHRARENVEIAQITLNDQDQDGDVTDNVAIGNTNGDNLINGEAFTNSSGFLSTVQNSGNNVLIQNSTIINVSVDASPN